jgi:hypothetical protein
MPAVRLSLGNKSAQPFSPQTTIRTLWRGGCTSVSPSMMRPAASSAWSMKTKTAVRAAWCGAADQSGHTVTSVVYFCVLQAGEERRTQKLVLPKQGASCKWLEVLTSSCDH